MKAAGSDIQVMLIDDEELVRRGFRQALEESDDITVVADVRPTADVIDVIRTMRPRVVLVDTRVGPAEGVELVRRFAIEKWDHRMATLVMTRFDHDDFMFRVLKAGAAGFLLKNEATQAELIQAIGAVAAGHAFICPSMTRRLIDRFEILPPPGASSYSTLLARLSGRELEVLMGMAAGKSNQEIAAELHLTAATVKSHVSRILGKLRLTSRIQAALLAYQVGLIRPAIPAS